MNRYDSTPQTTNSNGNRVYLTTIYPNIPESINDIYFYSNKGDRLDMYALEFYKDVSKWVIIAKANNLGHGSLIVPPMTQIRIPMYPEKFQSELESLNKK